MGKALQPDFFFFPHFPELTGLANGFTNLIESWTRHFSLKS